MRKFIVSTFVATLLVVSTTGQAVARDNGRGAAIVGALILGAAALAASSHDHRHKHHRPASHHNRPRDRVNLAPFSPERHVTCYPAQRACYRNNGKLAGKWTHQIYRR